MKRSKRNDPKTLSKEKIKEKWNQGPCQKNSKRDEPKDSQKKKIKRNKFNDSVKRKVKSYINPRILSKEKVKEINPLTSAEEKMRNKPKDSVKIRQMNLRIKEKIREKWIQWQSQKIKEK